MNESESITFTLHQRIDELSAALLARHPTMPTLLREIHKTLRTYPEQVTVLEPEEIQAIIEGLKIQTKTSFTAGIVSGKGAGAKAAASQIKKLGIHAF